MRPDDLVQENAALRQRISRLSAAVRRIGASLDPGAVLREVVDSARSLTSARRGLIVTIDDAGHVQDLVTSGLTPDDHRDLAGWSEAPRLFEHFRDLSAPLRLRDARAYIRSLGFSSEPILTTTLQGTPMRCRGVHVGNFFLGDKEGGQEFTDEDEEILVLFASQAAAAIVNARAHRDRRRARADLEGVMDTSPVGVVVLDTATGALRLLNRESRRIVESLRTPGRPVEDLLQVIVCRRADGREVSLDKLSLAQHLGRPETLRAEEIVLSVPDGRSVKALLNATPIRSAEGQVESVVATMQDLAPLDELERMRAEFLGMVSRELRAPLTSIKGSAATALASLRLDRAEVRQLFRIVDEQADRMGGLISDLLDAGRIETGTLSVDPQPAAVADLVEQARSTFLSSGGRHAVRIDLPPELPWVLADRQRIVQVLDKLLANAARHSPESTPIRVDALRDGVYVAISVSDEGWGVPPEQLPHLFQKYAGSAGGVRERGAAGYGLGLPICKGLVEAHGGRIRAESAGAGRGTRFTFTIPTAEEAGAAPGLGPGNASLPRHDSEQTRILVVDDDPRTLRYVRDTLAQAGYAPLLTGDPRELSGLIRSRKPQLVLLDLLFPETDGIELMKSVPELADLPVVFISAYGRDETIARALDAGAADYIVKPFSPTELTARVRAALRRRAGSEPFLLKDLAIHYEQRRVSVAGHVVPLTATEFELLRVLSVNAGRVSTYASLLRQVWGARESGSTMAVRAHMKELRRKLGDNATRPVYIFTERGVGYRMPGPGDP